MYRVLRIIVVVLRSLVRLLDKKILIDANFQYLLEKNIAHAIRVRLEIEIQVVKYRVHLLDNYT